MFNNMMSLIGFIFFSDILFYLFNELASRLNFLLHLFLFYIYGTIVVSIFAKLLKTRIESTLFFGEDACFNIKKAEFIDSPPDVCLLHGNHVSIKHLLHERGNSRDGWLPYPIILPITENPTGKVFYQPFPIQEQR